MRSIDHFLIGLDSWPWSAINRAAFGLSLPPVFDVLFAADTSPWTFVAFFVVLLLLLRVVPALLRLALPFSAHVKEIWAERRALAKRYDSYQWRKLFWIGLGLLPHLAIGETSYGEWVVTIACLVGGSVGLSIWQKVGGKHLAK
jgi:hypothetical protein